MANILPVCAICLKRFEAGDRQQKLGIEVDIIKDDAGLPASASIFIVKDKQGHILSMDGITLVILNDDLKKLKIITLENNNLSTKFSVKTPTHILFSVAANALIILDLAGHAQNFQTQQRKKTNRGNPKLRQDEILRLIDAFSMDRQEIPTGDKGKKLIMRECLMDKESFNKSSFEKAWSELGSVLNYFKK